MKNERNEHFKGFAKLLFDELDNLKMTLFNAGYVPGNYAPGDYERIVQEIIAQRAYDLVEHILNQTPTGARYIHYFKDMTAWPEQERFVDALADLAKIESKLPKTAE